MSQKVGQLVADRQVFNENHETNRRSLKSLWQYKKATIARKLWWKARHINSAQLHKVNTVDRRQDQDDNKWEFLYRPIKVLAFLL